MSSNKHPLSRLSSKQGTSNYKYEILPRDLIQLIDVNDNSKTTRSYEPSHVLFVRRDVKFHSYLGQ